MEEGCQTPLRRFKVSEQRMCRKSPPAGRLRNMMKRGLSITLGALAVSSLTVGLMDEEATSGLAVEETLQSRIRRVRVHLAAKQDDAEMWLSEQRARWNAVSIPVAKQTILVSQRVAELADNAVVMTRDSPELVGGSILSLSLLRFMGWKGRSGVVLGVAAAWVVFAPGAVSALAKSGLTTATGLAARNQ